MNYQLVAIQEDDGFFWSVVENKTNQIIDTFFFQDDAKEYASFLESGGAFAGFTPSFMVKSVTVNETLDESFMREFGAQEEDE